MSYIFVFSYESYIFCKVTTQYYENFVFLKSSYNARVVSSVNGGMGKSLFVKEKAYSLKQILMSSAIMKGRMSRSRNPSANAVTIPVHGTSVCENEIVESLLRFEERDEYNFPRIYHFDVAPSVSTLVFIHLRLLKMIWR